MENNYIDYWQIQNEDVENLPYKISYNGLIFTKEYGVYYTKKGKMLDNIPGIYNDTLFKIEEYDEPEEDKKIEKLSDELTYIKLVDNETFRKNVVNKINEIIEVINERNI